MNGLCFVRESRSCELRAETRPPGPRMVKTTISAPGPMSRDVGSHLPLKPVDLQLLLALAEEERHGYGLVQAIAEATDGLVQLDPGNLYRVIKRLLGDGLVAESERRAATGADGERRRYYRITALGQRVLAAEIRRLQALMRTPAVRTIVQGFAT